MLTDRELSIAATTVAIWTSGDRGWGSGTLVIKIDLLPDDGETWIDYGTFTDNTIEQIDHYDVLFRSEVVRVGDTPKATGFSWPRRRTTDAPDGLNVTLHAAVFGPPRVGEPPAGHMPSSLSRPR